MLKLLRKVAIILFFIAFVQQFALNLRKYLEFYRGFSSQVEPALLQPSPNFFICGTIDLHLAKDFEGFISFTHHRLNVNGKS